MSANATEKNPHNLIRIMPAIGKSKEELPAFLADPAPLSFTKIIRMNVFVNNQKFDLQQGATLFFALEMNGLQSQRGIAVAVNNQVVPKAEWQSKTLAENDKVTVIRATQGG